MKDQGQLPDGIRESGIGVEEYVGPEKEQDSKGLLALFIKSGASSNQRKGTLISAESLFRVCRE